jgi:hypothetical protein
MGILGLKLAIRSVLIALAVSVAFCVSAASADPTFPVMNASGGIYWRSAPDWNTPEATPGNGFYDGSTIAVNCYQSGAADVPGTTDSMWEQATVVAGPGSGSGWINEHFINDGAAINQPSPGVPPCTTGPPPVNPPPTTGGHAFPTMNDSGGIYWRSAPDWNTPEATTGTGFYPGTVVNVGCYQSGTPVPGSTDTMWEQASIESGPGSGSGWINEHFINDGAAIDQPSPGVPPCSVTITTSPSTPVSPTSKPPSPPTPTEQNLAMDPDIWCAQKAASFYQQDIEVNDWSVLLDGYVGTPYVNNWRCREEVQATVPYGEDVFRLPQVLMYLPIDFNAMCQAQFPGAQLRYVPGPVSVAAWPWECVGQAGKYYPPPALNLDGVVDAGGFLADAVPARTAGRLSLSLMATHRKTKYARIRLVYVGNGNRVVKHAGRYAIHVHLSPSGRRLLRRSERLHIQFVLRFTPRRGRPSQESNTATLNRRALRVRGHV